MRLYPTSKDKRKEVVEQMDTWIRGLNTLVSNTQIKPNELSEATDVQLVEDGKIQVPRDGQSYYGEESGSKVTGIFPYYKSDGTNQLIRMSGTTLQKYNAGSWNDIGGFAYTTGLNTEAVTAFDELFIVNGTDNLTKYDGSSVTSFTAISAPSAPTVTRTAGSAGTYTYSYKITAVTAVGETVASTADSETLDKTSLDSSNYFTITWSAVASAVGYNLYGRKDGQWYYMAYLEGNGSTTYIDKGTVTPAEAFTPPEGNTTGGPKGRYIAVYKDSLFLLGDPDNPSRLYYSAGGDLISDFTVGSGGGFLDVSKNDGQKGTGLKVFKDSLIIFKRSSIYQFSFSTSGLPQIEQVSAAVGAVNQRGITTVENDIFFVSDRGIFTIGNEAGFAFDVLRTNELSAKVRSLFQAIAADRIEDVSTIYATESNTNLVIFSYTPTGGSTNSEALVYDRERLGWLKWTNISANCWTNYRESGGAGKVLYGDDGSGYVKQILVGSDDFGSSISATIRMRAIDFGLPANYKTLKDIDVKLRSPTGSITMNIIKDGVQTVETLPLTTIAPSVNFAHYLFTGFTFSDSTGTGVSVADDNILKTKRSLNIEGISYLIEFKNISSSSFVILYVGMTAKPKSVRYRKSADLIA